MKDDFTQKFFQFLKTSELKFSEVSKATHNSESTIAKWRSIGIPKGKRFACESFMRDHIAKKAEEMTDANAVIPLEITQEQFRNWNAAALHEGELIEEWAISALDREAGENPLVADLPGRKAPLNPDHQAAARVGKAIAAEDAAEVENQNHGESLT